ncbi:MAG: pimeloyl-ACP methyl ester carboxylesterase [Pirellulaceae bacterium]|jgi:pimeloyl-ACP methyl ester carboxylesterase
MDRISLIRNHLVEIFLPVLLGLLLVPWQTAWCDENEAPSEAPSEPPKSAAKSLVPPNIVTRTLGGLQFWSDVRIQHDWRIQRNAYTEHFRLLDAKDKRHAWGTRNHCEQELQRFAREKNSPPLNGTVVLALHGTVRSRDSMEMLCQRLRDNTDYTVFNVSYASTRMTIKDHAESLGEIIGHLDGAKEIHLVAHSMGNLVIRHYFGDHLPADETQKPDPRIRRVVMLAPPNNGPKLARTFKQNPLFQIVWGVSGIEMANWTELEKHLATPTCEFGIVAGRMSSAVSSNPLIPGNDDLVLAIEETKLAGARDFRLLRVNHSTIMRNEAALDYTVKFLQHGYFETDETRQPLDESDVDQGKVQRLDPDAPPAALHQREIEGRAFQDDKGQTEIKGNSRDLGGSNRNE